MVACDRTESIVCDTPPDLHLHPLPGILSSLQFRIKMICIDESELPGPDKTMVTAVLE